MANTVKVTFTLDAVTVAALKRAARESGKPQSMIVREAIAQYGDRSDKMGPDERRRMLDAFHKVRRTLPKRAEGEAAAEIEEVRRARREDPRNW